jgi:hypothetical protein
MPFRSYESLYSAGIYRKPNILKAQKMPCRSINEGNPHVYQQYKLFRNYQICVIS